MGNRSARTTNAELLSSLNEPMNPDSGQEPQNAQSNVDVQRQPSSAEVSVETIQMNANIERGSFRLERLPEGTYSLEFVFSALCDCSITVTVMGEELVDSNKVTTAFKVDTTKYPEPMTYRFSKGILQPFPPRTAVIDLALFSDQQLTYSDNTVIPLIVDIRPDTKVSRSPSFEATILKFSKKPDGFWTVKPVKQKFTVPGRTFDLLELFGADSEGNECVVCMTEAKDTSVLPCRHLCLCKECANVLRVQHNSRCPICRVPVDGLLELKSIGV